MSFKNEYRPYTKEDIESLIPNQKCVYGLFNNDVSIYIGSGDIREEMLAHLKGDVQCTQQRKVNLWTFEVIAGDPINRENKLINEYRPLCNQQFGGDD